MLPNVPEFAHCYYGALRAGAVVVPMNVLLKDREVAFYLRDSGAKVLFAWHEFAEAAHAGADQVGAEVVLVEPGELEPLLARCEPEPAVVDRATDDTAVILYTSGTTGTPKGAELTHGNLAHNVEASVALFGFDETMVALGALPFFHAFGQTCALNATIAVGGRLTLLPRFDAGRALEIIARDRVTVFEGVPTMYAAMLNHRAEVDTSTLAVCISGGAALPVEVMRAFEARFGCQVLEGYGLSETSPVACFNRRDRERKPGSIGLPIEGVELRVARRRRVARPRSQRHEGLLGPRGGDRRRDRRRWLVPHGRHRPRRRRRLLLHRRPQEGRRDPRRLQRLPARDRGGPLRAPGRARGGRDRRPARRRSARRSARPSR